MRRYLPKLSYANVMATIAVFIALGGASYAAIEIPKNSVGAKQLKNGAVTPAKLGKSVKKSLSKAGSPGPAGPAGPVGAAGAPGAARAYAFFGEGGKLDAARSKGILGWGPACTGGPSGCTSPPPPPEGDAPFEYCFKLGFEPAALAVTPRMGVSYIDQAANRWDAVIPGRPWSSVRGGCAPGYRDASIRLWHEEPDEESWNAYHGFWVVFY